MFHLQRKWQARYGRIGDIIRVCMIFVNYLFNQRFFVGRLRTACPATYGCIVNAATPKRASSNAGRTARAKALAPY
jgi:hypothetical protein